ncbi:hypothetical protein LSAT2_010897 [Lamellibrachia satsuma]|nr:hypothetical protein LSAT2_010897 [Lamellibrachia satsuma]
MGCKYSLVQDDLHRFVVDEVFHGVYPFRADDFHGVYPFRANDTTPQGDDDHRQENGIHITSITSVRPPTDHFAWPSGMKSRPVFTNGYRSHSPQTPLRRHQNSQWGSFSSATGNKYGWDAWNSARPTIRHGRSWLLCSVFV